MILFHKILIAALEFEHTVGEFSGMGHEYLQNLRVSIRREEGRLHRLMVNRYAR